MKMDPVGLKARDARRLGCFVSRVILCRNSMEDAGLSWLFPTARGRNVRLENSPQVRLLVVDIAMPCEEVTCTAQGAYHLPTNDASTSTANVGIDPSAAFAQEPIEVRAASMGLSCLLEYKASPGWSTQTCWQPRKRIPMRR